MGTNPNTLTPKVSLLVMWIIWGGLLMGLICFSGVSVLLISQRHAKGVGSDIPVLVWLNGLMLVIVVPTVFFVRTLIFRRGRTGGALSPAAFVAGNIVFWAGCEGVTFFGIVTAIIRGDFWPTILFAGVAFLLQASAFPRGELLKSPSETFQIE